MVAMRMETGRLKDVKLLAGTILSLPVAVVISPSLLFFSEPTVCR